MPLVVATLYRHGLKSLATRIVQALGRYPGHEDVGREGLHLIGPFPVCLVEAREFLRGAARPAARGRWHGVVLDDSDQPVAAVEILTRRSAANAPSPSYAIGDKDAARVLFDALLAAEKYAAHRDEKIKLRLLRFPELQLATLWLEGDADAYVPVRDGATDGVVAKVLPRKAFIAMLRRRLTRATRGRRHATTRGATTL